MPGMDKISEAILDKVTAEAESIVKEAQDRAAAEIERAKAQWATRAQDEQDKVTQEAKEEALRIEAQAAVKARQELAKAKSDVVAEIIDRVKKSLAETSASKDSLKGLLEEACAMLDLAKGRVYVAAKDVSGMKSLIEKDKKLSEKVVEVKEYDCTGGLIVEDIERKLRVDNTYETRLEMLLPRLLPQIGKELFGDRG